jgi:hypothetical protein
MSVYFMAIWSILRHFFYFIHDILVYVMVIWYIFPRFGLLYQEKSGNPASDSRQCFPITPFFSFASRFAKRKPVEMAVAPLKKVSAGKKAD